MAEISDDLRSRCADNPEAEIRVIVTLSGDAAALDSDQLAAHGYWHSGLQRVPGLSALFTGGISGSQLLKLIENPAVAAVEEDQEFSILS